MADPSPTKRTRSEAPQKPAGEPKVYRLAVTGGPCAGKSTFLAQLNSTFEERTGYKVFCVPEAATLLVTGGLQWKDETTIENQTALLKTQVALEDAFFAVAKATKQPAIVVCDRGVMDGRAYCSDEQFNQILAKVGHRLEELRDTRYDAVLHLVTAAIDAPQHYNLDNPARFENVENAVKADLHLRNMYLGHPRVHLIDNKGTDFQGKLDRAMDFVYELVGHKDSKHRVRRYLVNSPPEVIPVPHVTVDILITVLSGSTDNSVKMLLRRQKDTISSFCYYNTFDSDNGDKIQLQHMISVREYANLIKQRDPSHVDLIKKGVSFTYRDNFFELSIFEQPEWMKGRAILYVTCDKDEVVVPPWLTVDQDTTGVAEFSSYVLSKRR